MSALDTSALDVDTQPQTGESDYRQEQVAALHALADFLAANPDVPMPYLYGINAFIDHDRPRERMAAAAKAMSPCEKRVYGDDADGYFTLVKDFGADVSLHVNAPRAQVCERVVTTETVTEQVPDPEALAAVPQVEVTREVEKVEWVCPPSILAAGEQREQATA